jgi:hypothetical protein
MQQASAVPSISQEVEELLVDLFGTIAIIDPATGEAQYRTVGATLNSFAEHLGGGDAPVPFSIPLWVHEFAADAIASVLERPRTRQVRSASLQSLHRVRELDARCMTWLVKQPGRTVREKVYRGRALGVVRLQSVDSLENRLARQVCVILAHDISRARQRWPDLSRHRTSAERVCALDALEHLCSRQLAESPVGSLPSPSQFSPSNALLWDRRYGKIWRVWRRLVGGRSRQIFPQVIQHGSLYALMWSTAAMLSSRAGAVAEEALVRPDLWPVDGPWMVRRSDSASHSVRLIRPTGEVTVEVVTLRIDEDRLVIDAEELTTVRSIIRLKRRRSWQAIADVSRATEAGITCSILLVPDGEGAEVEAVEPWTTAGLHALGSTISDVLGLPVPCERAAVTHPTGFGAASASGWKEAGWDVSGSRLLVADAARAFGVSATPLVAALGTPHPARWLAGEDAIRCAPEVQRVTAYQAWSRIEDGGGRVPPAVRELYALSAALSLATNGEHAPGAAARLAVAVPDYLDEAQVHTLRTVLPSATARTTIVWRSVAAALDWRARGDASGLAEGDPLLVLDLDAPAASATLLEMRLDTRESADPTVWERVPPERPGDAARRAVAREIELAMVHDALARHTSGELDEANLYGWAARVVDEGWVEAVRASPGRLHFIAGKIGSDDARGFAATGEQLLNPWRTRRILEERLVEWLSAVRAGTTWALAMATGRRPRALVLSRLCTDYDLRAMVAVVLGKVLPELDAQILHDAAACARGALVFVQRDAAGLPTWRDRLPDLYLDVRGGDRVAVFRASAIAPGQLVAHDAGEFELPAGTGARWYEFPLTRQQRGGEPLPQRLWLEHSSFPLAKPARVRIRVQFRYADDAFTIRVSPIGDAPFEPLELHWFNGQAEVTDRRLNHPPSLPELLPWGMAGERPLAQLQSHIDRLATFWAELCGGDFTLDAKQALSGGAVTDRLLRHLDLLQAEVRFLHDLARREVFVAARDVTTLPDSTQEGIARSLTPVLWRLAWLPESRLGVGKRDALARWSKPWESIRDRKATSLYQRLLKLEALALNTLSALRHAAPRQFVAIQLERIDERRDPAPIVLIGRVATAAVDELETKAVDALLEALRVSVQGQNARAIRDPLWALAAALWCDRNAVYRIGQDRTRQLLKIVLGVLGRLRDGWAAESVALELLTLSADVLFALTRLRGHLDGEAVAAGTELMDSTADLIVRVDRMIRHARPSSGPPGSQRLAIDMSALPHFPEENPPSPLVHALWAALRGECNVRIDAVRDE